MLDVFHGNLADVTENYTEKAQGEAASTCASLKGIYYMKQ